MPHNRLPVAHRSRSIWRQVEFHLLLTGPFLPSPSERMFPPTHENTARLSSVVGDLYPHAVNPSIPILLLVRLSLHFPLSRQPLPLLSRKLRFPLSFCLHKSNDLREVNFPRLDTDAQLFREVLVKIPCEAAVLNIASADFPSPSKSHLLLLSC